jgi:hypothetical protein
MVGPAMLCRLGRKNVELTASRSEADLRDQAIVNNGLLPSARRWCFWQPQKSEFQAAIRVLSEHAIGASSTYRAHCMLTRIVAISADPTTCLSRWDRLSLVS